jgi:hypothetical protein
MPHAGRIVLLLLVAAIPATAFAIDLCATLGEAGRFVIVTSSKLTTRRSTVPYIQGIGFSGSVCIERGTLDIAGVYASAAVLGGDLVATRAAGTALNIRGIGDDDFGGQAFVEGDVATGGGRIRGEFDEVEGVVDTTGSHPAVARCTDAMADAALASEVLAALAPTQVLGHVFVPLGEQATIDARGGGVVQIDSLVLDGQRMQREEGETIRTCDDGVDTALSILADPGDTVILNVGRVDVRNCARIRPQVVGGSVAAPGVILNVPGKGRRIRIGVEADLFRSVNLLAPQRNLEVVGSSYDFQTALSHVWVKRAVVGGFAFAESNQPCP